MKVLIIEDDLEIKNLIEYYFIKERYQVHSISDGAEGLELIKKTRYELLILDLMLPTLNGLEVTKRIKSDSKIYGNPKIIMLTAKTEIEDVLLGLETGADDYIKKPFDPRELLLRAKKLLIVDKKIKDNKQLFLSIEIDENKHLVTNNGKEITLSNKEYYLLLLLIKNRDKVVSREKILDKVWESNYYSGDRTVDVYISKLREKIPILAECIKTIKGVGYRLEEKI